MSHQSSERPAFTTDQIAALSASRETLTELDACTRKHIVPADDNIALFFPGAGTILGMADYMLDRGGRNLDIQVSRDFDPQSDPQYFSPLGEIDPSLPEAYRALPVVFRGQVSSYDPVRGTSVPSSEDREVRHCLYQVQNEAPDVGGKVVVLKHNFGTIESFNELTAEEKRIAAEDEVIHGLDPRDNRASSYSYIGDEIVRRRFLTTRIGSPSLESLLEVTDLTNLLRDVREHGDIVD